MENLRDRKGTIIWGENRLREGGEGRLEERVMIIYDVEIMVIASKEINSEDRDVGRLVGYGNKWE